MHKSLVNRTDMFSPTLALVNLQTITKPFHERTYHKTVHISNDDTLKPMTVLKEKEVVVKWNFSLIDGCQCKSQCCVATQTAL